MHKHIKKVPNFPSENKHPDGIDNPVMTENLMSRESNIWSHGYQLELTDGTWYELITKINIPGSENDLGIEDKEINMISELRDLYLGSKYNLGFGDDNSYFEIHIYNEEDVATLDLFLLSIESIYGNPQQAEQKRNDNYANCLQTIKDLKDIHLKQ